jgi:hypothetical protein
LEIEMAVARRKTVSPKPQDAIALLRADHSKVSALFEQYERTRSAAKNQLGARLAERKQQLLGERGAAPQR